MLEKEQSKILLRFYIIGCVEMILTTTIKYLIEENILTNFINYKNIISITIFLIGFIVFPTQCFWIFDIKDLINNKLSYKKFKKIKRRLQWV